jgi:hypothetical protein
VCLCTPIAVHCSVHWVPGALSPTIKRPQHEADHIPPSCAQAKKEWSFTYTTPYACASRRASRLITLLCRLTKQTDCCDFFCGLPSSLFLRVDIFIFYTYRKSFSSNSIGQMSGISCYNCLSLRQKEFDLSDISLHIASYSY